MIYTIDSQKYIMNEINNDLSMLRQLKYIDESSKIDNFITTKLKRAWDIILGIIEKIGRGISALIRKIKSLNLRNKIKNSPNLDGSNYTNKNNTNNDSSSISTFVKQERKPFNIYTWDNDAIFSAIENIIGMEQSSQVYDLLKSEIDNVWFNTDNPQSFVHIQVYNDYDVKTMLGIESNNNVNFDNFLKSYEDYKKLVEKMKRDSLNSNISDMSDMSLDMIELMGYALTKADAVISNYYSDNAYTIFNVTGK